MITVAGTVSREVLFDTSETVSAVATEPEVETVAVAVEPSVTLPGRKTASASVSLSSTLMAAVASVQFARCAVIVATCVPSISVSSTGVIRNVALVCPERIVTVAGTVAAVMSLLLRVTMRSPTGADDTVTVPVTGAAFSGTLAGIESASVPVTSNALLSPMCPAVSSARNRIWIVVCETVMLPVHTPAAKFPDTVGETGTASVEEGNGTVSPVFTVPMLGVFVVQFAEVFVSALPVRR